MWEVQTVRTLKRNRVSDEARHRARELRRQSTAAERKLWKLLRNRGSSVKFRRQYPIGPYIVDFYSPELALVIEVDGDSHAGEEAIQYDAERERYLTERGLRVKRFLNRDVMDDLASVIDDLKRCMDSTLSHR